MYVESHMYMHACIHSYSYVRIIIYKQQYNIIQIYKRIGAPDLCELAIIMSSVQLES